MREKKEPITKSLLIQKMNNIFRNLDEEKFIKNIFCIHSKKNTVSALIFENEEGFFSLDITIINKKVEYYLQITKSNITRYRFLISENDIEKIETISWIKKSAI